MFRKRCRRSRKAATGQSECNDRREQVDHLRFEDDITIGNPKGDVTIVEFFDYNCGYCRHALPDMETMLKKDKNVRFVLKEFPILGPDSVAAHKVSDAFRKLAPGKICRIPRCPARPAMAVPR
jgi:protein-disulfide isomerase